MTIRFRAKKTTSFSGSKTLTAITDNPEFFIGIPVVRTDGRSFVRSVYGHVITKFSGMGRFTYPWCSASARFARGSSATNAGPKLASKIPTVDCDVNPADSQQHVNSSFELKEVMISDVFKKPQEVNVAKATGHDNIPNKI